MKWGLKQKGFTIVELLIVVVVIAILAIITIVTYNGIQNKAKESAVTSALSQAVKKVEAFKSASSIEAYPTSAVEAGITGLAGVTYFYNSVPLSYCVQAKNGQIAYSATNIATSPKVGDCGQNGLVGWWQLNGNGNDASGNGWTATLTGSVAQGQNGLTNGAYDFNGTPPSAQVSGSDTIIPSSSTFSFWYNVDAWNTAAATSFIAKRGSISNGHFIMRLTSSNSLAIDCGGSSNRWTTGNALPINQWVHIVVTCTQNEVGAYINGVSVGSAIRTVTSLANSTPLQFAQDNSAYGLDGRMDDIRLYNRILSAGEIQELYTNNAQ